MKEDVSRRSFLSTVGVAASLPILASLKNAEQVCEFYWNTPQKLHLKTPHA